MYLAPKLAPLYRLTYSRQVQRISIAQSRFWDSSSCPYPLTPQRQTPRLKKDSSNKDEISLMLTEFYLPTVVMLLFWWEWNMFSLLIIIFYQQQK